MIPEIKHMSPAWSEHDILSLIKAQNEFVNDPVGKPITCVKWGAKSQNAIQIELSRIRTSGSIFLQRYFRENPHEWTRTDMDELNGVCQVRRGCGKQTENCVNLNRILENLVANKKQKT